MGCYHILAGKKLGDQLALINFPFYCLLAFISIEYRPESSRSNCTLSKHKLRKKDIIRLVFFLLPQHTVEPGQVQKNNLLRNLTSVLFVLQSLI